MTGIISVGLDAGIFQFLWKMFRLVNEQYAHTGPIRSRLLSSTFYLIAVSRSVAIGPLGEILTGSQSDSPSVKRWTLIDGTFFEEHNSQLFHDHWITAIVAAPARKFPSFPEVVLLHQNSALVNLSHRDALLLAVWIILSVSSHQLVNFRLSCLVTPKE